MGNDKSDRRAGGKLLVGDTHRPDRKRFIVRPDELLSAFWNWSK